MMVLSGLPSRQTHSLVLPISPNRCPATHEFVHSDKMPVVQEYDVHGVVVSSCSQNSAPGAFGKVGKVYSPGSTGDIETARYSDNCLCKLATGLLAPVPTPLVMSGPTLGFSTSLPQMGSLLCLPFLSSLFHSLFMHFTFRPHCNYHNYPMHQNVVRETPRNHSTPQNTAKIYTPRYSHSPQLQLHTIHNYRLF